MNLKSINLKYLLGMFILLLGMTVHAADTEPPAEPAEIPLKLSDPAAALAQIDSGELTSKGADSCLKCHDEFNAYPVMPIFKTKHATASDSRSPFADLQCEACHGAGDAHGDQKLDDDEPRPAIINFGSKAWTPVADQNAKCLSCHQSHKRIEWQGSAHEFNNVACADCHRIHVADDPVHQAAQQAEMCYQCHPRQRGEFLQASTHPVRFGKMACSDCHQVHGGMDMQDVASRFELCTNCHAEKRGPFLWEHAPATEDCTYCHQAHGSNHSPLLKHRAPFLCQQCHSEAGHPSVQYDGSSVASGSRFVMLQSCVNCHSQVHGSNHPSGVTRER